MKEKFNETGKLIKTTTQQGEPTVCLTTAQLVKLALPLKNPEKQKA